MQHNTWYHVKTQHENTLHMLPKVWMSNNVGEVAYSRSLVYGDRGQRVP
jgi:hypothetical protein